MVQSGTVVEDGPVRTSIPVVSLACLFAVLGANVLADPPADAQGFAPAPLAGTSREAALTRWVLTYAPTDDVLRARIAELAARGTPEAAAELFAIGEPARRVLLELAASDDALAERTAALRARMQDLQDEVERRDLYCDLRYLPTLGPAAAERVARIVPVEAPKEGAVAWCMERAGSLRWEPTLDRYVLAPPWDRDQAPRRWRHRDTVTLQRTQGLISPSSAFTAEFWVRWPAPSPQSLLGEEAWPGMSPNVPVDRECGFTFRRTYRGGGTATLDLTFAIRPNGWWTVESAPLHVSTLWEHIAVASDGRVVRIYRDGALVAARDASGVEFTRGCRDLALGVVPDGWSDRRANFDLRAFRISEGARYPTEFVPPHRFEKDGSTILLLDFTPGRESLTDLSGGGHDASGEGHWIAPHDPAALGAELEAFGGPPGAVVVAEAERGGRSGQWYVSDRPQYSEGACTSKSGPTRTPAPRGT